MEEEDNITVKWAQEDVETSYNLLNKINQPREQCDLYTFSSLYKPEEGTWLKVCYFEIRESRKMQVHAGPARRQHQHTDCILSHPTDGLHNNNKMIVAHFIINRIICQLTVHLLVIVQNKKKNK